MYILECALKFMGEVFGEFLLPVDFEQNDSNNRGSKINSAEVSSAVPPVEPAVI